MRREIAHWMRYSGVAPLLSYMVQKSSLPLIRAATDRPVTARRHMAMIVDRTCVPEE